MVVIFIKVIILAAGIGSRLGENLPKALVKVDGKKTILDYQLENLKEIVKIEDINIIVGFKKDLISKKYPKISLIYNEKYNETNTSKSLLIALSKIKNHDVLWLNGDVVFEANILNLILNDMSNNLVCVNNNEVGEEEVKYTIDNKGCINDISKSVPNGLGEAVGINFIKKEDIKLFISCLKECLDTDYFEKGIELAIQKGITFAPLDIQDNFCTEVDFPEDLKTARKFIKENIK